MKFPTVERAISKEAIPRNATISAEINAREQCSRSLSDVSTQKCTVRVILSMCSVSTEVGAGLRELGYVPCSLVLSRTANTDIEWRMLGVRERVLGVVLVNRIRGGGC